MPKTNSESDFGGSITSDEEPNAEDVVHSPTATTSPPAGHTSPTRTNTKKNTEAAKYENAFRTSVKSFHSTGSPNSLLDGAANGNSLRGAARFRDVVRRVVQMRHVSSMLSSPRGAGAEPGVDPRRDSAVAFYGHIHENCAIEVIDYSSLRMKARKFNNKEFVDFLGQNNAMREPWAKVRWICIGGISWDVLSALALRYDLHPLSLEDVLQQRGIVYSKADYFLKHLFLRVTCHSLGGQNRPTEPTSITGLPFTSSRIDNTISEKDSEVKNPERNVSSLLFRRKNRGSTELSDPETGISVEPHLPRRPTDVREQEQAQATIDAFKADFQDERVIVLLQNLFIFLLRDGTVVTIHQTPSFEWATPIQTRLRSTDTVLRKTADPSLLVESVLDLVVDKTMEIIEEYRQKIINIERDILVKTDVRSVRYLHFVSGDLMLHKRTLAPLKTLIYGLRRYDLDRCIAAVADSSVEDGAEKPKVIGFMSHKAKVYLADVHDHMDYILNSIEMFANVSENLINYTFNVANYQMSEVMYRLTLITMICLPLTILTGYFGMNFEAMFSVKSHSDLFFWEVAIPVLITAVTLFMWKDVRRAITTRKLLKRVQGAPVAR